MQGIVVAVNNGNLSGQLRIIYHNKMAGSAADDKAYGLESSIQGGSLTFNTDGLFNYTGVDTALLFDHDSDGGRELWFLDFVTDASSVLLCGTTGVCLGYTKNFK